MPASKLQKPYQLNKTNSVWRWRSVKQAKPSRRYELPLEAQCVIPCLGWVARYECWLVLGSTMIISIPPAVPRRRKMLARSERSFIPRRADAKWCSMVVHDDCETLLYLHTGSLSPLLPISNFSLSPSWLFALSLYCSLSLFHRIGPLKKIE